MHRRAFFTALGLSPFALAGAALAAQEKPASEVDANVKAMIADAINEYDRYARPRPWCKKWGHLYRA